MTKMRLTTLNLDQDCLDILGAYKNKSAKARECIRMHDRIQNDLDDEMRRRDQWERGMDALANLLVEGYERGPSFDLDELLADLLDITPIQVSQMYQNKYMPAAIKSAVFRLGKL